LFLTILIGFAKLQFFFKEKTIFIKNLSSYFLLEKLQQNRLFCVKMDYYF